LGAFSGEEENVGKPGDALGHAGLSEQDRKQLLHIARMTIEKRIRGEEVPDFKISSKVLQEKRGVFVTIRKGDALRGCIGFIQGIRPLFQAVEEMAAAAAFHDPRFPPVAPEELAELTLEVSVLTPLQKVGEISEIQVGTHGIYIVLGPHSGLLLPQVATEQGWDRPTFLQHTALKAGLPPEAWKDPRSEMYIFSADIFSE
jgi:AmmeMemoRadiSam system protein A